MKDKMTDEERKEQDRVFLLLISVSVVGTVVYLFTSNGLVTIALIVVLAAIAWRKRKILWKHDDVGDIIE